MKTIKLKREKRPFAKIQQKFFIGERVRMTFPMEPALKDVPKHRLTSTGVISKIFMKCPRTPEFAEIIYQVTLDTEILGSHCWCVTGSNDKQLKRLR